MLFRAILSALNITALWALLPREVPVDRGGKIDWIGAGLGTGALIVFNFVWKYVTTVRALIYVD